MAQNFTLIQEAFDSALQSVISSASISGITQILLYTENDVINWAMLPDVTTKLGVRCNMVPAKTTPVTLGNYGYVEVQGTYAIDIFCAINQGYTGVQQLGDAVMAAFPRGLILTLGNGDKITINTSSPSSNVNQGGWLMGKLYCRQFIVDWFGYVIP
jgi:hypothetical protein